MALDDETIRRKIFHRAGASRHIEYPVAGTAVEMMMVIVRRMHGFIAGIFARKAHHLNCALIQQ